MMQRADADHLAGLLEPLLPDYEVTSVPWHNESPRAEHIVTIWEDGIPILDIFGVGAGFVVRRLGRGKEVFRTASHEAIATAIKEGAR